MVKVAQFRDDGEAFRVEDLWRWWRKCWGLMLAGVGGPDGDHYPGRGLALFSAPHIRLFPFIWFPRRQLFLAVQILS